LRRTVKQWPRGTAGTRDQSDRVTGSTTARGISRPSYGRPRAMNATGLSAPEPSAFSMLCSFFGLVYRLENRFSWRSWRWISRSRSCDPRTLRRAARARLSKVIDLIGPVPTTSSLSLTPQAILVDLLPAVPNQFFAGPGREGDRERSTVVEYLLEGVCRRRAVASVSRNVLTSHLPRLRSSELAHCGPQKTVSSR
jgi:hypothetical protein